MAEPYSPLRYPGGKAKLADFLVAVLRNNGIHEPHYVEPFAGGAGAALRLLCEEYVASITINDADPRIRCFWQAVTAENDEFLALLDGVQITVDEWHNQRAIYSECNVDDPLQLGFATFFLNRTTRSGIVHNGGPIGGYDQTGNFKIDARFNRADLVRRVRRVGIYAERIQVSGEDGLVLLEHLQEEPGNPQTFVYLDPPYYAKGAELYLNRMTHQEHADLAAYLSVPRDFPWVMTYDNVSEIREMYQHFPQLEFSLSYSAYERREGRELLIHPAAIELPPSAANFLNAAAA